MTLRLLVLALSLTFASGVFAADTDYVGVDLVPWSKKIDEGQFQSARDYEATKKFYHDKYKGWKTIKWHAEVSLPTVKYVHVENTHDKRRFDGINIYELPGGHVRYTILPHVKPAPTTTPEAAPTKK